MFNYQLKKHTLRTLVTLICLLSTTLTLAPKPTKALDQPFAGWMSYNSRYVTGVSYFEATSVGREVLGVEQRIQKWCLSINDLPATLDFASDDFANNTTFDATTGCWNVVGVTDISQASFRIDTTLWPDGTYVLNASVTDSSNATGYTGDWSFETDNAPDISVYESEVMSHLPRTVAFDIYVTRPGPHRVSSVCVTIDGVPVKGFNLIFGDLNRNSYDSGCWATKKGNNVAATFVLDGTLLSDGEHLVLVTARSAVGQTTTDSSHKFTTHNPMPTLKVDGLRNRQVVSGFFRVTANLQFDAGQKDLDIYRACLQIDGFPCIRAKPDGDFVAWPMQSQTFKNGKKLVKIRITDTAGRLIESSQFRIRISNPKPLIGDTSVTFRPLTIWSSSVTADVNVLVKNGTHLEMSVVGGQSQTHWYFSSTRWSAESVSLTNLAFSTSYALTIKPINGNGAGKSFILWFKTPEKPTWHF